MNTFSVIALLYASLTLTAAGLLYLSLNGKVDHSAKYFFTAELLSTSSCLIVALINFYPELQTPEYFLPINYLYLLTEISIFFSVYALLNPVSIGKYLLVVVMALPFTLLAEVARIRFGVPGATVVMYGLMAGCSMFVLRATSIKTYPIFADHPFIKWFRIFEWGIFIIFCVLAMSPLLMQPAVPRGNSTVAILIYSFFIPFGVFRFVAYIGFRITWLGGASRDTNTLNQSLAFAVDERNTLTNKLMASNRVVGISALASSLAHELSQPLTAIALQADSSNRTLDKIGISNDRLHNSLKDIQSQSMKLARLVTNLRKLFSEKRIEKNPFDLVAACYEILEIIEPNFVAKKIKINKQFANKSIVLGDVTQFQQVLINLLNNAVEAIEVSGREFGEITLSIQNKNNFVHVDVIDSGTGIDPEFLPYIFDLHKTTKEDGAGVGLWLCKTILIHHDGLITASNCEVGGAKFTIELPLMTHSIT